MLSSLRGFRQWRAATYWLYRCLVWRHGFLAYTTNKQTNTLLSFPELLRLSRQVRPPPFLTAHYTGVGCMFTMGGYVQGTGFVVEINMLFCYQAKPYQQLLFLLPNPIISAITINHQTSPTPREYRLTGCGSPNLVGLVERKGPVERFMGAGNSFH